MRRIVRPPLSQATLKFLKEKRTDLVAKKRAHRTRVKEARRLWSLKNNRAFDEIRRTLDAMCSGLKRCMYCEDSRGCAIDHVWPLSAYPLKAFEWDNLNYGCTPCNTSKGDSFPLDASGRPVLLDPTVDDPALHLRLTPRTGRFKALTDRGKESRKVYGLHRKELTDGRMAAWDVFQALIADYGRLKQGGHDAAARKVEATIGRLSFSSVFIHLVNVAQGPGASRLRPDCLAALRTSPEIKTWL